MGQKPGKIEGGDARPRVFTKTFTLAKSKSEEDNEVHTKIHTARETHSLDLQSCNLRSLPPALFELDELLSLNLSNNFLKELDKNITRLTSLNNLKLNGNKLGGLPKIQNISSLEVLDIGKNNFGEFPPSVCEVSSLVRLIAHCNRFVSLPPEVGNLAALTVLDLSTNNIPSLPAEIGQLKGLKTLDIDNNLLTELPSEFANLSNLTQLNCAHNRLEEFPVSLCQLMFLQQLDLHGNKLATLPEELSRLDSLTKLNLNDNCFSSFPESLVSIRGLIELDLSENKIKTLSGSVSRLAELATLNLAKNRIAVLPPEVGEMTVLMSLNLSNNKLGVLPPELGKLTYLSKLIVPGNKLKQLPSELSTISFLEEFDISSNKIAEFPSELCKLDRLKHLKVASNRLTSLPQELGALYRLNELIAANNKIDELPDSISKLTRLQSLSVFGNRIARLPNGVEVLKHVESLSLGDNLFDEEGLACLCSEKADMPALEHLMLSGNRLKAIPQGLCRFTTLRQFCAGRNEISSILPEIGALQKLNLLDLSCNLLTILPEELASLSLLRELNLSYNQLKEVPSGLGSLKNLHVLSLNHNLLRELPTELKQLNENNCYHMDLEDNLADLQSCLQKKAKKNGVKASANTKGDGKDQEKKISKTIKAKHKRVGTSETIGKRPSMEDTLAIRLAFTGIDYEDFFAVFDGHAGRRAAVFASENFHLVLADQLNQRGKAEKEPEKKKKEKQKGKEKKEAAGEADEGEAVTRCLRNAFIELDELMKDFKDGATAVVAMVSKRLCMAFVANVGDARAVLCRNGKAIVLTVDHTPKLASEEQRIRDLNGYITSNRVNGVIAISRSLGDSSLKPLISAEPGLATVDLQPEDQFLILACDGCWDVVDNQQAVEIVEKELQASGDPVKAAVRLKETAYWCGSGDNISVIVVLLNSYVSKDKKEKETKGKEKIGVTEEEERSGVPVESRPEDVPDTRKRGGTDSLYEHMSRGARSLTMTYIEDKRDKDLNNANKKKGKDEGGTGNTPVVVSGSGSDEGDRMEEERERRSSSFSEEVLLPRTPDVESTEGGSGRKNSFVDSKDDIPSVYALQSSPNDPQALQGVVVTRERARSIGK